MTNKTLIGLAAITALAVAGAIAAAVSRQAATERVTVEAPALPGLMERINDVGEIALQGPEDEFSVRFDGERWVTPALASFPADFDKVKKALIGLAELRTVEAKTADPERYAALGLAAPDSEEGAGTHLRLLSGAGDAIAALTIGDAARAGADRLYVRRDGEERTWLAEGALDLGETPKDWVDTMVIRLDGERVRRVTITHADDGEVLELERPEAGDEPFDLVNMPEGATLRSPMTLDNLGRALAFLRFDDVAAASAGPPPGGGDSTAVFETFDGVKVTVALEKRGEENWARFDADWDPDATVSPEPAPQPEEADADAEATGEGDEGDGEDSGETAEETPDIEAEIAQLLSRTQDWVFRIPDFKAEQLGMRMARLIELPEAETEGDGAESGSELVPGSAVPPVIQLD